jgi:hypothetical protein
MSAFKDLSGRRFGKLLVEKRAPEKRGTNVIWVCVCDCGKTKNISSGDLLRGHSKSCGCVWIKHGYASGGKISPEYNAFSTAKDRCTNPDAQAYRNYGKRGIEFRFKNFAEFIAHIGPRPTGRSLDRIDNNGHYEIGNVRWATREEQAQNKRKKGEL